MAESWQAETWQEHFEAAPAPADNGAEADPGTPTPFAALLPEFLLYKAYAKLSHREAWQYGRMILRIAPEELVDTHTVPSFLLAQNVLLHMMSVYSEEQSQRNDRRRQLFQPLPAAIQTQTSMQTFSLPQAGAGTITYAAEIESARKHAYECQDAVRQAMAVNTDLESRLLEENRRRLAAEAEARGLRAALAHSQLAREQTQQELQLKEAEGAARGLLPAQLGAMHSAATVIQRRARGIQGRRAFRQHCQDIYSAAMSADQQAHAAWPPRDPAQPAGEDGNRVQRRRARMQERLAAQRARERSAAAEAAGPREGAAPALVVLRRRCKDLEASLQAVSAQWRERMEGLERENETLRTANEGLREANRELSSLAALHNLLEAERQEKISLHRSLAEARQRGFATLDEPVLLLDDWAPLEPISAEQPDSPHDMALMFSRAT